MHPVDPPLSAPPYQHWSVIFSSKTMANKFSNVSVFRHVKGSVCKRELNYCDLSVAPQQLDSAMCKANSVFWCVNWAGGAGGSICVHRLDVKGVYAKCTPDHE